MASKTVKNADFDAKQKSYVNRMRLVMSSKLRKNAVFDDIIIHHVHLRRKTGVLVHMGWHRKCQKRLFSLPFSVLNCFCLNRQGLQTAQRSQASRLTPENRKRSRRHRPADIPADDPARLSALPKPDPVSKSSPRRLWPCRQTLKQPLPRIRFA